MLPSGSYNKIVRLKWKTCTFFVCLLSIFRSYCKAAGIRGGFWSENNIPDEKIPEAKISDENECSAASGASCNSSSIGKVNK